MIVFLYLIFKKIIIGDLAIKYQLLRFDEEVKKLQ